MSDFVYGNRLSLVGILLVVVAGSVIIHIEVSYLYHERRCSLKAGHFAAIDVGKSISIYMSLYATLSVF